MASRRLIRGRITTAATALLGAAVVAALLPGAAAAGPPDKTDRPGGGGPAQASILFTISDSVTVPDTPGSEGLVYVVADVAFSAELTFVDKRGEPSPLSTSEATEVTLDYVVPGAEPVALPPLTLNAGESTVSTDPLTIHHPHTGVVLRASAETKRGDLVVDSPAFDVLIESKSADAPDEPLTVGGDGGELGDCNSTEQRPVCGDLIPSPDFADGAVLSQGCLTNDDCLASSTYVQALAAFDDGESPPAPATLIMSCDKSMCGGGAIKKQLLNVSLSPNPDNEYFGEFTAPACEAKGVVTYDPAAAYSEDNAPFCVDYVQSKRDNAGDTHLYLLFTVDAKVRFP